MKKMLFVLTFVVVLLFVSCIVTADFSKLYHLALNAIANGSKETALDYSFRLKGLAKGPEQLSMAYMISGYSYFLNGNYSDALREFDTSDDYLFSQEACGGIILTTFMLNQYDLVSGHLNALNTFEDEWLFTVNTETLNKSRLYEICALSLAIRKNQVEFDALKTKVSPEKMQEMEVFFFE